MLAEYALEVGGKLVPVPVAARIQPKSRPPQVRALQTTSAAIDEIHEASCGGPLDAGGGYGQHRVALQH